MRRLMISAAVLALLAIPAMAQPEEPGSRGKASAARQGERPAPAPQAAPTPAPQVAPQAAARQNFDRGGDRGGRGERGGNRGAPQTAPAAAAPVQQAAPAQPQGQIFDRSGNRGQVAQPNAQPGDNRNRDNRFGNGRDDRRNGQGDRWRNDNRGNGFGNRPGFNGQRHDFSSFRDFHRTFRAPHRYRAPSYRRPSGWYAHRWTFGEVLPSLFWGRDYWLYEFEDYGLPSPPYGAVWVRVGNDALMIDEDSGEVITVAYDVFY